MTLDEVIDAARDDPETPRPGLPAAGGGDASAAALRIYALGTPEVYRGRRRLRAADWAYAKPRELLFYLLLEGPQTREQIGLAFWPDATKDQLRARFRTALYELRRALGGTEWVVYADGRYAFNRGLDYWFDVEALDAGLTEADRLTPSDPGGAAEHLRRVHDLYRADLLDGETAGAWTSPHRDALRRRYAEALLSLAQLEASAGRHAAAVDLYRRAVARDELSEEAHRALARALARGGDRLGALRQLDEMTALIRRELDVAPSAETTRLRAQLERGGVT